MIGKRLVVTMVKRKKLVAMSKRQKSVAMVKRQKAHQEEMVKDLIKGNASSLEKQEKDIVIGCSDRILVPMFW